MEPSSSSSSPLPTLSSVSAFLGGSDSLLEEIPLVLENLDNFQKLGGSQASCISLLLSGYYGRGSIFSLFWDLAEQSGESPEALRAASLGDLEDLIIQHFSLEATQAVFQAKEEPPWLDVVLKDLNWSRLLPALREKIGVRGRDSLFLNFIEKKLKLIKENATNEPAENSQLAVSLNAELPEFRSFLQRLFAGLPETRQQILEVAAASERNYLFVQAAIKAMRADAVRKRSSDPALSSEERDVFLVFNSALRRLCQDLSALPSPERRFAALDYLMNNPIDHPVLSGVLASLARSRPLTIGDVQNLFISYRGPQFLDNGEIPSTAAPPVEFLQFEELTEFLLDVLFNPNSRHAPTDVREREKFAYLLAYSSSVIDLRIPGFSSSGHSGSLDFDASQFLPTYHALIEISKICQAKAGSSGPGLNNRAVVDALRAQLSRPIVAAGVFHWIRLTFTDISYYESTFQSLHSPILIALLIEISENHLFLHQKLFLMIKSIFSLENLPLSALQLIEYHKLLFLFSIHFLSLSLENSLLILSFLIEFLPQLDHSMIRFFLRNLLERISSPFQEEFLRKLFDFLLEDSTKMALQTILEISVKKMSVFSRTEEEEENRPIKKAKTGGNRLVLKIRPSTAAASAAPPKEENEEEKQKPMDSTTTPPIGEEIPLQLKEIPFTGKSDTCFIEFFTYFYENRHYYMKYSPSLGRKIQTFMDYLLEIKRKVDFS